MIKTNSNTSRVETLPPEQPPATLAVKDEPSEKVPQTNRQQLPETKDEAASPLDGAVDAEMKEE